MSANADNPEATMQNQMSPKQIVQFFVLLPLGLGLFLGAAGLGMYRFVTIGHHILYTALFATLAWTCYGLGSKLAAVVLKPWKPSLIIVLLVGHFVGGFGLWWPLRDLLNMGFEPFLMPDYRFGRFWPPPADNLGWYITITLQGLAGWVLANWLDFRYRRVPRFGFVPPPVNGPVTGAERRRATGNSTVAAPTLERSGNNAGQGSVNGAAAEALAAAPRLHQRLPEKLRDAEIHTLQAEEHYTKVHTDKGHALLLLRFSDAIAEMDPQPGMQVHRSYWVSRQNVERLERAGKRLVLHMPGGLEVPVSRSYRVLVKNAGFSCADRKLAGNSTH